MGGLDYLLLGLGTKGNVGFNMPGRDCIRKPDW